jgi:hypothetical protein
VVAQRNEKGQFVKGESPNPGGRPVGPKGLAERSRLATRDGDALVAFFQSILEDTTAETRDRMEAGKWLADRGWGKSVQTMDVAATIQKIKGYGVVSPDDWPA